MEFDITSAQLNAQSLTLKIQSELPLDGVKIALSKDANTSRPQAMTSENPENTHWQTQLNTDSLKDTRLFVVVAAGESLYYGETETTFTTYETSFSQSNMK